MVFIRIELANGAGDFHVGSYLDQEKYFTLENVTDLKKGLKKSFDFESHRFVKKVWRTKS
jgi:hypothetical protein